MTQKTYGYARVSSKDQNSLRQIDVLLRADIQKSNIFVDHASGKNFDRPKYQKLKSILQPQDLVVIKCIDRLGRNYDEIIQEWKHLTKEMLVNIRVLDLPLLDTTTSGRDLTSAFISDIVLQILSYVAEQERTNIRQRQAEGIALAKSIGKHLGRPRLIRPENFSSVYARYKNGDITLQKALAELDLKRSSFFNFAKDEREK